MNKIKSYHCFLLITFLMIVSFNSSDDPVYAFRSPPNWPKPVYNLNENKYSKQGFLLGRKLFYDPVLSSDSTISCSSCHLSFTAFTHADHKLSHGIRGLSGTRNAPALMNLAWNNSFMWDGGVNHLEVQPINPITNPLEMDSKLDVVVAKLQRSANYRKLFFTVFKDSVISSAKMLKALAMFTGNLVSANSKYDSVMRKMSGVKFTPAEEHGYELFKSSCSSCHKEPLFTDNSFRNNGLAPDTFLKDQGRFRITNKPEDKYKFRVPTLRNIEYSAPYFHDGRAARLKEVVEHYVSGLSHAETMDPILKKGIRLEANDKKDLIAFLKTLTDRKFLYDPLYRER